MDWVGAVGQTQMLELNFREELLRQGVAQQEENEASSSLWNS